MPGESFGAGGAGHVRVALTVDETQITEACKRIARLAATSLKSTLIPTGTLRTIASNGTTAKR